MDISKEGTLAVPGAEVRAGQILGKLCCGPVVLLVALFLFYMQP